MTMRLALVIEGDGSGATKALEQTTSAVEQLGKSAQETRRQLGGFEWNEAGFDRARLGLQATATEGRQAAGGMDALGEAGERATPRILRAGEAADRAGGRFSDLGSLAVGAAGGLAATLAITALGEGLKIAAGFAAELFAEITSNQPMIERALQTHAALVGRIKGAWAEAEGAASSYGETSIAQLRFESQQNVARLEGAGAAEQRDLFRGSDALRPDDVIGNPFGRFGPFKQLVADLRRELRDGQADLLAFRRSVAEIAEALPTDSPFRGLAEQILADTQAAAELQAELARARDLLQGLTGDAEAAATALGGNAAQYRILADVAPGAADGAEAAARGLGAAGDAAAAANPPLAETVRLLREIERLRGASSSGLPSPARAALIPLTRGFAGGGFTGAGSPEEPAGIVHRGEFVFDPPAVERIGLANLEAMRVGRLPGFASGGYVGSTGASGAGHAGLIGLVDGAGLLRDAFRQVADAALSGGAAIDILKGAALRAADRLFDIAMTVIENALFGSGGGLGGLLGSLVSGLSGSGDAWAGLRTVTAGVGHRGAVVGRESVTRRVGASVFLDAPRLHGGGALAPGEVPFIGMAGEEIGWPRDLARKYGGDRQVNNFYIETPNPRAFVESRASVARAAARLSARVGRHS